jgi:nucleotide-binding universal stress UspA family protein
VSDGTDTRPVLLCFDGSEDAAAAIASAGELLGSRPAVVLTVQEPIRSWQPYDPATILDAPIGRLLSKALELEEIADEVAHDEAKRGAELARAAGFEAQVRVARGKAWRAICDAAGDLDAAVIVLGARGLSRVQSALLGSVSAAVSVHAGRPVLIVHPGR